jgi:hypothetical protein
MNDFLVLALFILTLVTIWFFGAKHRRWTYVLLISSILTTTLVFVVNRTGVSVHYNHYAGSGLDNFFYTQNYIFVLLGAFLLSDLTKRFAVLKKFYVSVIVVVVVVAGSLRVNHVYARNDFMQYQGPLKQQVLKPCQNGNKDITFSVYPFTFLTMTEPRQVVCTAAVYNEGPPIEDFGLRPSDAIAIGPGSPAVSQTFVASQDNLDGIAIYLSTYYQERLNGYHLWIKDASCSTELRLIALPHAVKDNAYATLTFESLSNSRDKRYCFMVTPDTNSSPKLALQLSREGIYDAGVLSVNGRPQSQDIVFQLLY